jgi:2,3,4,5-tetrahydropyridine-2-carboxylate N-succinyltransferase
MTLAERIERLFEVSPSTEEHEHAFAELLADLNAGRVRAAEPDAESHSGWRVNAWVKKGVLLGFRLGKVVDMSAGPLTFLDKHTYPLKPLTVASGVRVVPGGSSIRTGAYVAPGVTCMPPMYINTAAYVDEGTMVDSHALVGSCAQIGKRVHLSAASQIGGVLEPVGALPVIVEDDVLIGGNCGVYEGTIVKSRAVLGAGTILTGSTPLYDLVHGHIYRRHGDHPLVVPSGAVVVPGSRAVTSAIGQDWNLSLYTPVIVKYRDEKTDLGARLEELLR